jgi:OST3 / OST6 family, transporter family
MVTIMDKRWCRTLGLLLALLLVLVLQGADARLDAKQRADALVAKAKASKGGIIEFGGKDFDEFTSKPRRYGLVVLLTAMSPEFRCTPCK